jgi:SAM-dependent methyltransferase
VSHDDATAEFADRLAAALLGALELATIELGVRLGLYSTLSERGPLTARELAAAAGISDRYAREWLEQQAVAGVLEVADARAPQPRFTLPAAHAPVLLDDDNEACMKAGAAVVPWIGTAVEIMTEEFRNGAGAEFGRFGLHHIQAAFSRPAFVHHLTQNWLPAMPDVQQALTSGRAVRIAEVGCGQGLAAITIARAYPNARVDGFDLDEASIAAARAAAALAGVADRVHFHLRDAADPGIEGNYQLVLAIEMLHDVPDPVGVLATMRRLAGGDGAVLVIDERSADAFGVPASDQERLLYAFSTLHCLAVGMQNNGAGTGTPMRGEAVRDYAGRAGFSSVEILAVDHPQFRLYRLR